MRFLAWLLAVSVIGLVCGCGIGKVRFESDSQLNDRLTESLGQRTGVVMPLRELAPGDWDRLLVIDGYTPNEQVQQAVGPDVYLGGERFDSYEGQLLVFYRAGKPVRAVKTVSTGLPSGSFPGDTIARSADLGGGQITLGP